VISHHGFARMGPSGTMLQMPIDLSMAAGHARYSAHMGAESHAGSGGLVGPKGLQRSVERRH
jgi:hypothetical protein